MTKLTKKRISIIDKLIREYGIEFGNNIFISISDLADNINNRWNAKYFINTDKYQSDTKHGYALPFYRTHRLFRAIRDAAKKSGCIKLKESYNNKSEYLQIISRWMWKRRDFPLNYSIISLRGKNDISGSDRQRKYKKIKTVS